MIQTRSIFHYIFTVCLLLIPACSSLPENSVRRHSYTFADTENTRLGKSNQVLVRGKDGKSGFHLLSNGLDAFVARAVLADQADRSIDVQYYLYHGDLTGKLLSAQLIKAADRGVRVRLLVDDMDQAGRELNAAILDTHPNIEVRLFNPFIRGGFRLLQYITRYGSVTRRMHNKSFTVDGQVTILGGRNIGDEYFEANPDLAFSDLDVLVVGPVAGKVSTSFDLYWNNELAYPITTLKKTPPTAEQIVQATRNFERFLKSQEESTYLDALRNSEFSKKLSENRVEFNWGEAEVLYDQPEKLLTEMDNLEFHLIADLVPYLTGMKKELVLFSPYFVPGKKGTAFFRDLRKKGVRVKILTNSLASLDVGIVHAGYAKYRKDLLRCGVELYELNRNIIKDERKARMISKGSSNASLHSKSFVFDRKSVFIGSLNFDPRAILHNTEIGVVFESHEIAESMAIWFDSHIETIAFRLELKVDKDGDEQLLWHGQEDGRRKVYTTDPHSTFWQRLGIGVLSLLPIDSLL